MNALSNALVTAKINALGAELCSLQSADGTEVLWQADPTFWDRHAPVLFPIVGRLQNDQYTYAGSPYSLFQHGFARDISFTLIEETSEKLVYQTQATAETRTNYPFDFELRITYRLLQNGVAIEYAVTNHGKTTMPFSIGAHPGLNLPLGENDLIEDCYLELEKQDSLDIYQVAPSGFLNEQSTETLKNVDRIQLTANLFDDDALVFINPAFDKLTLCSKKNDRRVSVEFPDFQQVALWAKPGAPYVCIEPWFGYVDPVTPYGEIENKPGILLLESGKTFRCEHRICIEK